MPQLYLAATAGRGVFPDSLRRCVLPEIDLGPLTVQTFGLSLALGFIALGLMVARGMRELGKPVDWTYEGVFAAAIGGLIGARLNWIVENPSHLEGDLLGNLFGGSGLIFFGGLVGGAAGVLLWARWRGFLQGEMFDLGAPAIALGYAVGRIGCQLSGDGDYGIASDLPWAMAYPEGTIPTTVPVHPTPVYETVVMGLAALVLWHLRWRYRPGTLFALYLVIAGVERFLVEFIRRNEEVVAGLTLPQIISLAMVAGGAAALARLRRPVAAATA